MDENEFNYKNSSPFLQRKLFQKSSESEILDTERSFKYCNKITYPSHWLELQDKLAILYKNYMDLFSNGKT